MASLLSLAFSLFYCLSANAQSYTHLTAFSKYYCGHLPSGKNKLFEAHGSRFNSVAFAVAQSAIKANILLLKARSKDVNQAISNIQGHKPEDSIIAALRTYVSKSIVDPSDPFSSDEISEIRTAFSKDKKHQPTKAERLAALKLFDKGFLKPRITAGFQELSAAKACQSNTLPLFQTTAAEITTYTDPAGSGTSVVVFLKIDSDGSLYDDGLPYEDWYCVKNASANIDGQPTTETTGRALLFGYDPCRYGTQSNIFAEGCGSLLKGTKNAIGAVIHGRTNPGDLQAAAALLQSEYGGSYSVRQRKNGGDDCTKW